MTEPLRFKRGADIAYVLTWGTVDLTGYTLTAHARERSDTSEGAPLAVATVTIADQVATPGRFTVSFDSSDTETWPLRAIDTDVRVVSPSGYVTMLPTISILIERRVTV